jgi:predicted Zn-dependent protease
VTPQALDVAEAVLRQAAGNGDEAEAIVLTEQSGLARFAGSEVHQPTLIDNVSVTVRLVRGTRVGTALTNRIDDEGLRDVVGRASESADAAPEDPTFPGLADPEPLPEVAAYDEETAALGAAGQARLAAAAIAGAGATLAYGYFTSARTELAIASTRGIAASQPMTDASVLVLAAGDDLSGYAERTAWRVGDVDPEAVGREAAEKAGRTHGAVELEPGAYRAVLERYAIADLLEYFAYDSLGALGLLEGRSYFTGRLGQAVFDSKITVADDALDPRGLPKAFDFEGQPKRSVPLVEAGVARDVVWDRQAAAQAGGDRRSTSNAVPPHVRGFFGPIPLSLSLGGGEAGSLEELAEAVGDGIHVTRLHYLSVVDPREGVITGMTRDGTFRIRDGKLAEPLVNLRFTVSLPELLADVPALTREVGLVNSTSYYDERYAYGVLAPALATGRFNVTGIGSRPGI